MPNHRKPLRRVGAMWRPRGGSKSLGSGSITINGHRQRFVVFRNDRKVPGSRGPDFVLMSSDEPELDSYSPRPRAAAAEEEFPGGSDFDES